MVLKGKVKTTRKSTPTIDEVSQAAEVSRATVSRYLNSSGYVGEETRKKIELAINEIGYIPNKIAQSLTKRLTGNIALVVSDISNPITASYANGVESIADKNDYNMILCNTGFNLDREVAYVTKLMEKQIDGVVIAPCTKGSVHLRELGKRGIPLVFLTRKVNDVEADYVCFDNEDGSYKVVRHLISLNHRRIGIIGRDLDVRYGIERFRGYEQALQECGITVDKDLVRSGKAVEEIGYEAVQSLLALECPPTAVFASTNLFAVGVYKYCKEHGIRIPDDLAVASFESFSYLDPLINPPLTANTMPTFELGATAAQLLFDRIGGKNGKMPLREVKLKGELVVRESTVG